MLDMNTTIGLQADIAVQASRGEPRIGSAKTREEAKQAAEKFEAMFISEMLKPIFESVEVNSMFGGGQGEKMFRSVMVDEYGKSVARSGGIGIADTVMNEILRMQEEQGRARAALALDEDTAGGDAAAETPANQEAQP